MLGPAHNEKITSAHCLILDVRKERWKGGTCLEGSHAAAGPRTFAPLRQQLLWVGITSGGVIQNIHHIIDTHSIIPNVQKQREELQHYDLVDFIGSTYLTREGQHSQVHSRRGLRR